MALFPLHHEFPCKDHVFQHGTSIRHSRGEVLFGLNGSRRFSSDRTFPCPAEVTSSFTTALWRNCRVKKRSSRGKLCLVRASSDSKAIKKRLKLLDSYFGKLQGDNEKPFIISTGDEVDQKAELSAEKKLESLTVYLDKQQKDAMVKPEGGSVGSKLRKADIKSNSKSPSQQLNDDDDDDQGEDILNFYTVSILASINVGMCLFEAAAPVRNNDMGLLSLPLLYGAKINDLIMAGEWWRLVTPMFLVQDQQIGILESLT